MADVELTGLASSEAIGDSITAGPILINGLASSEAISDPIVAGPILIDGLPSGEAYGILQVDQQVDLAGLASSEAYGTAQIDIIVLASGEVTQEGYGSAQVDRTVPLEGLVASEAYGAHRIDMTVHAVGEATGEAYGAHRIDMMVHADGVASPDYIGTAVLSTNVVLSGVPSTQAIGAAFVSALVSATSTPSAQAIGTARIDRRVSVLGRASYFASGTPSLGRTIDIQSVGPDEVVGNDAINLTVHPTGLASDQAIGSPIFPTLVGIPGLITSELVGLHTLSYDQFLAYAGRPSQQAIGGHRVGVDDGFIIGGAEARSGLDVGNQLITLSAFGLDMSSLEDRFTSSIDGAKWTTVLTGSGNASVLPGAIRGTLQLGSGRAANSSAYIRSVTTHDHTDARIVGSLRHVFKNGEAQVAASLGLYASSSTWLRVALEYTRTSSTLRVQGRVAGTNVVDVRLPTITTPQIDLRILRDQERVLVFVGGVLTLTTTWTNVQASVEIGVANDADGRGSTNLFVTHYTRNPVILFGDALMTDILDKRAERLDGLTPSHLPGEVTIRAKIATSEFEFSDTFTYLPSVAYKVVGVAGLATLRTITDQVVSV